MITQALITILRNERRSPVAHRQLAQNGGSGASGYLSPPSTAVGCWVALGTGRGAAGCGDDSGEIGRNVQFGQVSGPGLDRGAGPVPHGLVVVPTGTATSGR